MIGKTNAVSGGKSDLVGEKLNLSLRTNQSAHSDLTGVNVRLTYADVVKDYTWEGSDMTLSIPPYVPYTVSFGNVDDYKTPNPLSFTAVPANSRSVVVEYKTEIVSVTLVADDGSSTNGQKVTINGVTKTYNGVAVTQKVAHETNYSVSVDAKSGYSTPATKTFTASEAIRNIEFTYLASSLKVYLESNQPNDTSLNNVKATVSYGSTSVEVESGERILIPTDTTIKVSFPSIEGYKTPSALTFTNNGGLVEKTATYLAEKLIVNVSATDGSAVNDTKVYVGEFAPVNGVYIQDTSGRLWEVNYWDNSATPNGIAVITSECSFVMALGNAHTYTSTYGGYGSTISGVTNTTSSSTAAKDYNGESNTTAIINALSSSTASAAKYCRSYIFPNGSAGYLGGAGEWKALANNKSAVDSALSKCGGNSMSTNYWTSTQNSRNNAWYLTWSSGSLTSNSKNNSRNVRAFTSLSFKTYELTPTNGQAIIKLPYDMTYDVWVSEKSGYSAPAMQSYTASQVTRSISMVYTASALIVNILSNQTADVGIEDLEATVSYGSTSVKVKNGGQVDIPTNQTVTITFPDRAGFKKPDNIVFTNTNGGIVTKNGTYSTEVVSVSTYADEGTLSGYNVEVVLGDGTLVGTTTSDMGIFSIPSGSQYTVSCSDVDGFTTPSSQTYTASYSQDARRDIHMAYEKLKGERVNVSVQGLPSSVTGYEIIIINQANYDVMAKQTTSYGEYLIPDGVEYFIYVYQIEGYHATYPTDTFIAFEGNLRSIVISFAAHSGVRNPTNGVYIQDTDGFCHTASEWTGEYTPNGVAVKTNKCGFVISLESPSYFRFGGSGTIITSLPVVSTEIDAMADVSGYNSTPILLAGLKGSIDRDGVVGLPAVEYAYEYIFPNGKRGYMGALGEYMAIYDNNGYVQDCFNKLETYSPDNTFWTTTQTTEPTLQYTKRGIFSSNVGAYDKHSQMAVLPLQKL